MQMNDVAWSEAEQAVAQSAFEKAHAREVAAVIDVVRQQAQTIQVVDDMWRLHDFLSARRHDLDGKYDYQYSALIFAFAQLVKEGWLSLEDLSGLEPSKLAKITALARM